ncbi:chemotaxis protein CheW [Undibacterium fentianense]|uniref:Chemotaxis protein CheW n=1 Tax=Undibacterium fentianense TaxID=2828728 RepID=A0A941E3F1_9BURK|nr:chemotaxis protein CheW [Undibacterium fentianense]MBR7799904.1 chemotaxis protein CheW [Undibacterium fentianense]
MTEKSSEKLVVQETETGVSASVGRRARLRDFQSQLMERMQAAKAGSHVRANQLGVLIGKQRYLIDLREAGEIVTSGNLTKVPLTKPWYLGLSNVRGSLTSVIDYSLFEGNEATFLDASCRVLAFSNSLSFNSGLLVSKVLGLRNADEMDLIDEMASSDEPQIGARKPWVLNRFIDADGHIWSQLSLSLLVQDQEFLHIGL